MAASLTLVQILKQFTLTSGIRLFKRVFKEWLSLMIVKKISWTNMFCNVAIFIFIQYTHFQLLQMILVASICRSTQVRWTILLHQLDACATWLIWSFPDYFFVSWGFYLVKRDFILVCKNWLLWLLTSNFIHHVVIRMRLGKRLLIDILQLV